MWSEPRSLLARIAVVAGGVTFLFGLCLFLWGVKTEYSCNPDTPAITTSADVARHECHVPPGIATNTPPIANRHWGLRLGVLFIALLSGSLTLRVGTSLQDTKRQPLVDT